MKRNDWGEGESSLFCPTLVLMTQTYNQNPSSSDHLIFQYILCFFLGVNLAAIFSWSTALVDLLLQLCLIYSIKDKQYKRSHLRNSNSEWRKM